MIGRIRHTSHHAWLEQYIYLITELINVRKVFILVSFTVIKIYKSVITSAGQKSLTNQNHSSEIAVPLRSLQ